MIKFIKKIYRNIRKKEIVNIPYGINEQKLLDGRVAFVTGGNKGIGLAIADDFVRHGCKVIIAARNLSDIEACVDRLNVEAPNSAKGVVFDVTEVRSFEEVISSSAKLYGKIDILVNCAGINCKNDFLSTTEDDYDRTMSVNAKGTFFLSQTISKYYINNGIRGNILNVSSASALRPASTPYIISKWAIKGMTVGFADYLSQYGIVVNAIAPGAVATDMLGKNPEDDLYHPFNILGRYEIPSEIAKIATFLVSDFGRIIVGDTCYATGGSGVVDLHR